MTNTALPEPFDAELAKRAATSKRNKYARFTLAALSAIPWVGSIIAASAALHAEKEQGEVNELHQTWLRAHGSRVAKLEIALESIVATAVAHGSVGEARLEDPSYLKLVEQGFRVWDSAPTDTKREQVRRILSNASVSSTDGDDLIRLFLTWVETYDDVHFRLIAALHHETGLTGADLWNELDGRDVRDDSADADLFKLMIRDLSTGGVIRQHRDVSGDGRMYRKPRGKGTGASPYLASPMDGDKPYELTQLGHQFVGYALDEPSLALAGKATGAP